MPFSRRTINEYINAIRQVFYWGCDEEIVPAETAGALRMVKALQMGKSSAAEYDPIGPVPDEIVEKTLPHIEPPQVRDMVLVQRFIGGRPQDVCNMPGAFLFLCRDKGVLVHSRAIWASSVS